MELILRPEYIYYPSTGDYGGSQAPEEESVEITNIFLHDTDSESDLFTLTNSQIQYVLKHHEDELKEYALNEVNDNKKG